MAMVDHLVNIRGTDALSVCATDLPEADGVESGGGFWGKKTETAKELIELLQVVENMLQTYMHVACACFFEHVFNDVVFDYIEYVICNLAFQCHVEALQKER